MPTEPQNCICMFGDVRYSNNHRLLRFFFILPRCCTISCMVTLPWSLFSRPLSFPAMYDEVHYGIVFFVRCTSKHRTQKHAFSHHSVSLDSPGNRRSPPRTFTVPLSRSNITNVVLSCEVSQQTVTCRAGRAASFYDPPCRRGRCPPGRWSPIVCRTAPSLTR